MQHCLINGIATDYISVQERTFQYGDGLFETIACVDNGLQFWSAHYNRLQQSAQRLSIACPDEQLWLQDIHWLCEQHINKCPADGISNGANGVIKLVLSRGCSERGYRVAARISANRIVSFTAALLPRYFAGINQEGSSAKAAALCVCQQRVSINPSLAGLKHLNRLENVMARNEWKHSYTEGLMLDANAKVIEGSMSNIFAIKDSTLLTPALDNSGVAGIIRQMILNIANENKMPVVICDLNLDDIFTMDELFICNSLMEILPVKSLVSSSATWQATTFEQTDVINQLLQTIKHKHVKRI